MPVVKLTIATGREEGRGWRVFPGKFTEVCAGSFLLGALACLSVL